jgi:hypothetical protein
MDQFLNRVRLISLRRVARDQFKVHGSIIAEWRRTGEDRSGPGADLEGEKWDGSRNGKIVTRVA